MSHDEAATNDYANCFYVCRYCNQDRNAVPTVEPETGRRLLNPCSDPWVDRFEMTGDRLRPKDDDDNAAYTHDVYDLDDPRKVEMRRYRRESIQSCLRLLDRGEPMIERLLEKALQERDPELAEAAGLIEDAMSRARQELAAFRVVPQDARKSCPCGDEGLFTLPAVLQEQTVELEALT